MTDFHFLLLASVISIIIFIIITIKIKRNIIWIFLLCTSLIPLLFLLFTAVYATFNGSGLVGDYGGIDSGLLIIVLCFVFRWYIFIPDFILFCLSLYKIFFKKYK